MHVLEEQVLQYEIHIQTLTDAILFAAQGAIYPQFINPEQIRETAELVTKSVPDARFSISYENCTLADLVRVADLSIMLYDTRLIHHITIPLIGYSQYDLYKASMADATIYSKRIDCLRIHMAQLPLFRAQPIE